RQLAGRLAGQQEAPDRERSAEVPRRFVLGPGAVPAEAVAIDEPPASADLEVLDDAVEQVTFREIAARVASGGPDIAPDEAGPRCHLHPTSLEVAAPAVRDRRTGKDDQAGVVLDGHVPLLSRVALQRGMDAG